MTIQEKQRINELRSAGYSYQAIADETGFSLGSIKMYFKRSKEAIPVPRCEQCHKPLRQDLVRSTRRFCSDACRRRWWVAHPESMKGHRFTCLFCGKEFFSHKPGKYCSRSCYYASRRGGVSHE
mgnify:CR=1 FL=1|jgi:hypothetical protein